MAEFRTPPSAFTHELWHSIEPIYAGILRHPSIAGFADFRLSCHNVIICDTKEHSSMKRLSVREMRAELTSLEKLLGKEGEVLITRRGKAIARLLPVRSTKEMPSHAELRASMPLLKTGSERLIRADRDER